MNFPKWVVVAGIVLVLGGLAAGGYFLATQRKNPGSAEVVLSTPKPTADSAPRAGGFGTTTVASAGAFPYELVIPVTGQLQFTSVTKPQVAAMVGSAGLGQVNLNPVIDAVTGKPIVNSPKRMAVLAGNFVAWRNSQLILAKDGKEEVITFPQIHYARVWINSESKWYLVGLGLDELIARKQLELYTAAGDLTVVMNAAKGVNGWVGESVMLFK